MDDPPLELLRRSAGAGLAVQQSARLHGARLSWRVCWCKTRVATSKWLARQRGFDAQGFQASAKDLPRHGAPPVIVHLKNGHFVVALREQGSRLHCFDPALGRTLHIDVRSFLEQWTGFMPQVITV